MYMFRINYKPKKNIINKGKSFSCRAEKT